MIYTRLNEGLASLPTEAPTDNEKRMFDGALNIARISDCIPHKVGAVIFHRTRVYAEGINQSRSHPMQAKYNKFSIKLHAEIAALIDGLKENPNDISGSTIAVARVRRGETLGCSFPCVSCFAALDHAGIRRIICCDATDSLVAINV